MLTEEQKHQAKFFIKKFEATKETEWCINVYTNDLQQHCAIGHTLANAREDRSVDATEETGTLCNLMPFVTVVNDGRDPRYRQPTPRARVLAALYDLLKP